MRNIFLLVLLSFCFLPSVSYSSDIIMGIARDKASKYIQSLREGNYEACYELRQSLNKYEAGKKKKIKKAMKKAFKSTRGDGDNILHFIVRLEDSDALKQMDDQALFPDIKLAYDVLGPDLFVKLLVQENNKKISPAQEAVHSKGLAYRALVFFLSDLSEYRYSSFREYRYSSFQFSSSFDQGLILGLLFGGLTLLSAGLSWNDSGLIASGGGMLAGSVGACYMVFKKERAFHRAVQSLDPPLKKSSH